MSDTVFTWTLDKVRTTTVGELTGVIVQAEWHHIATRGDLVTSVPGSTELDGPDDAFVPLDDVVADPATVIGWVHEQLGKARIKHDKAVMEAQLNAQAAIAQMEVVNFGPAAPTP